MLMLDDEIKTLEELEDEIQKLKQKSDRWPMLCSHLLDAKSWASQRLDELYAKRARAQRKSP